MDLFLTPSPIVRAHEGLRFRLVRSWSGASQCGIPIPRRGWIIHLFWLSASSAGPALIRWAVLGFLMLRSNRITGSAYLIPVIVMAIVVVISPSLRTSGRKGFYLDAMSLKPGMTVSSVKRKMRGYNAFDKYEDTITFTYESSRSTVDTVSVTTSIDGQYVLNVEFSPD